MVDPQNVKAGILARGFARATTAAIVVAAALLFAGPFFLALLTPFIGR